MVIKMALKDDGRFCHVYVIYIFDSSSSKPFIGFEEKPWWAVYAIQFLILEILLSLTVPSQNGCRQGIQIRERTFPLYFTPLFLL